jgi:putative lipoic acid-binding regulatory protein
MTTPPFGDAELEFPVEVHFRIVCLGSDPVRAAVRATAESLGLGNQLTRGNSSSGGKYHSFQLTHTVASKEEMEKIDRSFRAVDGVKMVL